MTLGADMNAWIILARKVVVQPIGGLGYHAGKIGIVNQVGGRASEEGEIVGRVHRIAQLVSRGHDVRRKQHIGGADDVRMIDSIVAEDVRCGYYIGVADDVRGLNIS